MTVRPLRDRRYVVETAGGTYVVGLDAATCTCPDHAIRGARCKHLRRVAMEVTADRLPAPDERVGVCAICGTATFLPMAHAGPGLCGKHKFERAEIVRDRETDDRLVVIEVTDTRADEYRTTDGELVASYPTNDAYGDHEPVVEVAYLDSLAVETADGSDHVTDDGDSIAPDAITPDVPRYGFPASRLVRINE